MPARPHYPKGYIPTVLERINHVTAGNCRAIIEEAVIPSLSQDPPACQGRGVVTCAGGGYLKLAYASIRKLRELNETIPVQVWYLNEAEIDGQKHKFDKLGVEFCSCAPHFVAEHYRRHAGWPSKSVAVKHCPFRDVLFLDADSYPLLDPNEIFDNPDYRDGLLVFPDGIQCRSSNAIFHALNIYYDPEFYEWEAGQFVVDKVAHWKAVQFYAWMNAHSYCFYKMLHGDKDLLPLAALRLGEPFVTGKHPDRIPSGYLHRLNDGKSAFHHMLGPKRGESALPYDIEEFYAEYDNL